MSDVGKKEWQVMRKSQPQDEEEGRHNLKAANIVCICSPKMYCTGFGQVQVEPEKNPCAT